MKLKLTGQNGCYIADLNLSLALNDEFECSEEIGSSLLIQGKFTEIKEKGVKKDDTNITSV